jgi:hypothetical protein
MAQAVSGRRLTTEARVRPGQHMLIYHLGDEQWAR